MPTDLVLADSRVLYTVLIALVGLERLAELLVSRRNLKRALARGGVVAGGRAFYPMAVLHGALLVAAPVEVWVFSRPWVAPLGIAMVAVVIVTMVVRAWVVATLGGRWSVFVVVVPGDAIVTGGPFRFMRHPNYAAVLLEVVALPLVHSAWLTALAFGLMNVPVLAHRISVEEGLLREHTDYGRVFPDRGAGCA